MLSAELRGTALVTGGGRGIGANIARELARAGMDVAVTGRTAAEVRGVAEEIGGRARSRVTCRSVRTSHAGAARSAPSTCS